jgi:heat shock protein HslJ
VPVLVLVLALAGCGDTRGGGADQAGTDGGGDGGTGTAALDGRTFRSTQVRGHELVPGTRVQLAFDDGQVTASAGCNLLSGSAALSDGTLQVSGLGGTEMGCDPALMAQDSWLADFLTSGPAAELSGDVLDLGSDTSGMLLTEAADLPLSGTTWRLDGLVTGEAVASLPEGAAATLVLTDDGALTVDTGCRVGTARVTVTPAASPAGGAAGVAPDGTLALSEVDLPDGDCSPGALAADRDLVQVLGATESAAVDYALHLERLTLTNGDVGATFVGEPAG